MQSPNGLYFAMSHENGRVNIFDVPTGKLVHSLQAHTLSIRALLFSPDSNQLITGSDDKRISVFDVHHGNTLATLTGHASWITSLAISSDGLLLASGSADKKIKVWDLETKLCVQTFDNHSNVVSRRHISILTLKTCHPICSLSKTCKIVFLRCNQVWGLAFSPDNSKLASASEDKSIVIFQV